MLTPEELADIRGCRELLQEEAGGEVGELMDRLLAHIDEQAAEIKRLHAVREAEWSKWDQQVKSFEMMISAIREQAAYWRKKAIEERGKLIRLGFGDVIDEIVPSHDERRIAEADFMAEGQHDAARELESERPRGEMVSIICSKCRQPLKGGEVVETRGLLCHKSCIEAHKHDVPNRTTGGSDKMVAMTDERRVAIEGAWGVLQYQLCPHCGMQIATWDWSIAVDILGAMLAEAKQ